MNKLGAFAVAAAVATGAFLLASDAGADYAPPTMLSAGAMVDTIKFEFSGTGAGTVVTAESCGHATLQGGGDSEVTCRQAILPAGALRTAVLNLRNGDALAFWRAKFPGL